MRVLARATRTGDTWAVEVPEIPGLYTQATDVLEISDQVIDAAATLGITVTRVDLEL